MMDLMMCWLMGMLASRQQLRQPESRGCMRLKYLDLQLTVLLNLYMPTMRSARMPRMRQRLSQFYMQQSCRGRQDTSTYCTSTFVVTINVYPTNCPWIMYPSMPTALMVFNSSLMKITFSKHTTQPNSPRLVHTMSITISVKSRRIPKFPYTQQSISYAFTWMLFEKRIRFYDWYSNTQECRKGVQNRRWIFIFNCFVYIYPEALRQFLSYSRYLLVSATTLSSSTVMVCLSSCSMKMSGSMLLLGPRKMTACPAYSLKFSMESLGLERQMLESTRERTILPRQQFMRNLYLSLWVGTRWLICMGNQLMSVTFGRQSIFRIFSYSYSKMLPSDTLISTQFLSLLICKFSRKNKSLCRYIYFLWLGLSDSKECAYGLVMMGQQMRGQQSTIQRSVPGWKKMKLANSWLLIQNYSLILLRFMQSRDSQLDLPMYLSFVSFIFQKNKEYNFTLPSSVRIRNRFDWAYPEQWNHAND